MALGVCIADPGGLVGLLYSSAAWPMPAPVIPKTIADAVASMRFLMDFTPSRRAVSSHAQIRTLFSLLRFRVMGSALLTLDRPWIGAADQGGEWKLAADRLGAAGTGTPDRWMLSHPPAVHPGRSKRPISHRCRGTIELLMSTRLIPKRLDRFAGR